jgi:arginyl-tRNA synthetase
MIRDHLATLLQQAIATLPAEMATALNGIAIEIDLPKQAGHGDLATNLALVGSKAAGTNPRALAEMLAVALATHTDVFEKVEVAGPGFLNFTLKPAFVAGQVARVRAGDLKGSAPARPLRINVEFVSVNPNGPITIGSGRGAAYGSALCNVLEAAGHTVHREYYINDGVNSEQMRLFGESVRALAEGRPVPENGYKGDYVEDVAQRVKAAYPATAGEEYRLRAQEMMIAKQHEDLAAFAVEFDTWFSEQSLHNGGQVEAAVERLRALGTADDRPVRTKLKLGKGGKIEDVLLEDQPVDDDDAEGSSSTVWLRSTRYGDDQDRVLRRRDGRLTYIAADVAYHDDKFNRPVNADKLITVLGPDHHGYIGRLTAVVAALRQDGKTGPDDASPELSEVEAKLFASRGERDASQRALAEARERLEVMIFQIVRFLKDGKPAPMRKRDGNIYAIIDLLDEIGAAMKPEASREEQRAAGRDVARFFYLMRHHDTALDFDLELAVKQSDENPVFYVQYAHARICSVIAKGAEAGLFADDTQINPLVDPREKALILKICDLPHEIDRCAQDYAVNHLANYATELARAYHAFYDACRVVAPEQSELSAARLALCDATRLALARALGLLGISAPERM